MQSRIKTLKHNLKNLFKFHNSYCGLVMLLLKASRCLQFCRKYSCKTNLDRMQRQSSSTAIRNTFLDYFVKDHNHRFIRSSPVTPFCDPTVPFVNAGMNQFKNVFLGKTVAPCERAANSQKCIRISGKHNDLDIIGTDGYHHTFFEMLGNWSFGDYYKESACKLAWDLLTKSYMIDPNRLYVTYFGGDEALCLQPDIECKEIWQSIGVPPNRIIPFGTSDNFWEMGLTGPCGPCTEIHIDHLPNSAPEKRAHLVNAGLPELTELWNIVFIEYYRKLDGTIESLPKKYIDTGMGFERLVAVLQGKSSNYDTDLFVPIFNAIHKETKMPAYTGIYDQTDNRYPIDYAYRVLADHVRMCSICIADGMYPQTNYRLRKIVRKSLNLCDNVFNNEKVIQNAVVPEIVNILGGTFPELEKNINHIRETFRCESEHYKSIRKRNQKEFHSLSIRSDSSLTEEDTIDFSGFPAAFREVEQYLESNPQMLPVEFLYDKLHVSHGLSDELIGEIAKEKCVTIDMDEFGKHKQKKKFEAKMSHQKVDSSFLDSMNMIHVPQTDYSFMYDYSFDKGNRQYNVEPIKATIQMVKSDGDVHYVVVDKTNFYHTAGGQDGDIGLIIDSNGTKFTVESVVLHKNYVIHIGRFEDPSHTFCHEVELHVNPEQRTTLSQHHTAMHLLQAAIKHVTNQIVFQQSSHVTGKRLSCELGAIGKRIDYDEVCQVEELVRTIIREDIHIVTHSLMAHDLYAIDNVTIIPGEIYPDENIRVLKISSQTTGFESIEPCCGTHARNTGDLDDFCITTFKWNSNGSYDIEATAGVMAKLVKDNGQQFMEKFKDLKRKIEHENPLDEWKKLDAESIQLTKELNEKSLPYAVRSKAMAEMEPIKKHIKKQQNAHKQQIIITEMLGVLFKRDANNDAFVIHVLNTPEPLDHSLFSIAEEMCNDLPMIIVNISNNKIVNGKASVPIKYSSKKFDVKQWMNQLTASLNIKCKIKKKKQFEIGSFADIPRREYSASELQMATDKARLAAKQAFTNIVSADQPERDLHESKLIARIDELRSIAANENNLDKLVEFDGELKELRNCIKDSLIPYATKEKCLAAVHEMNERIQAIILEAEKTIVTQALDAVLKKKLSYVLCTIRTDHILGNHSMMHASDILPEMPAVIINRTEEDCIGRVSLPIKYTRDDFRAKHLGDIFIAEFDGNFIHDGTRYNTSVCDFRLNYQNITDEQLDIIFQKVEQLLHTFVDK